MGAKAAPVSAWVRAQSQSQPSEGIPSQQIDRMKGAESRLKDRKGAELVTQIPEDFQDAPSRLLLDSFRDNF